MLQKLREWWRLINYDQKLQQYKQKYQLHNYCAVRTILCGTAQCLFHCCASTCKGVVRPAQCCTVPHNCSTGRPVVCFSYASPHKFVRCTFFTLCGAFVRRRTTLCGPHNALQGRTFPLILVVVRIALSRLKCYCAHRTILCAPHNIVRSSTLMQNLAFAPIPSLTRLGLFLRSFLSVPASSI